MEKSSNLKSSLGKLLTALFDLMLLNLLWIICSIPLLTMGTATSALFSVMLKVARSEQVSTLTDFFKAFKNNFKQSFVLGLIGFAGAFVAYMDISYGLSQTGTQKILFLIVGGIVAAIWLIFTTYVYPLQGRFENTVKGHIKNAFALAVCNPGKTILMGFVTLVPWILFLFLPWIAVAYIGWAYLLFAISAPAYFNCKTLRLIFDKMTVSTVPTGDKNDET